MIATLEKTTYLPADLLQMSDAATCELVDGRLVEKNVSALSCLVEGKMFLRVGGHCEQKNLGPVWTGTMGFQCFGERSNKVRKPDLSFIKAARFTVELLDAGYIPIAPDLAVEVLSPGDLAYEVNEKIEEYLQAGVVLIWVVDPENRVVDVYRQNGEHKRLHESDELLGEDVLPEFRCRVAELFPVT
jgi:Uma2 family endonuclease